MAKHTKTATGIAQLAFVTPKLPHDVCLSTLLPYKVPRAEAEAAWKESIND